MGELDFGAMFDGTDLWLEIAVDDGGGGGSTVLTPRQHLTAAPYALFGQDADTLDTMDSSEFATPADIADHAALPNDHHVPTVDTDTVLTEAQVKAFALALLADPGIDSLVAIERDCPGAALSTDRYTDCGKGTVRDNNTG